MGCMNQRVPVFMRATADDAQTDASCWSELVRFSHAHVGEPTYKYVSMDIESLDQDELRRLVFKLCDAIY